MKMQRKAKLKGVYVEFRDRRRRRKSQCVTIDGCTPKQAVELFTRAIEQQQKAG